MTTQSPIFHGLSLLAAFLVVPALAPAPAVAAGSSPRAWVSNAGIDAPGCGSVMTPCRQLQYAHDNVVEPGGSIYVKDPAGFASLVIRNAISIINDGSGTAALFVASGDAIDVQAGPNDAVFITGLVIDGVGTGNNGINLISGGSLTVTDCVIKGFSASFPNGNGIAIQPSSGAAQVDVHDTIASNNTLGVYLAPQGSASVDATLKNVEFNKNADGLAVAGYATNGTVSVTVEHSTASGNGNTGVSVAGNSSGNANARLVATDVSASHNLYGFYVGAGAVAYFSSSSATENSGWGVSVAGTAFTLQNNLFRDNANNVSGSLTGSGPGD